MIRNSLLLASVLLLFACSGLHKVNGGGSGWISLFDGKTLNGWKFSEKPGTFSIDNGSIKVAGPRSHLYYNGTVMNHGFKNFEVKAQVMTTAGSNSGFYFHTLYILAQIKAKVLP